MRSTFAAGLLALSFAAANPVPQTQEGSVEAFSIEQVGIQADPRKKLGPVQYMKSLNKYQAKVPTSVRDAAAAAVQSGTVPAQPEQYDQEYLCPVDVGTPAQRVMLDFDTGSADLWTFSSLQPSNQRSGHSIYTPGSSSTGRQQSGETWNIMYGDGSGAKGVVYSDKVVIGGVTATSQAVEAATSVSSQFVQDTDNDGLVGLAFDNINTASPRQVPTFFDSVRSTLPSALFTATLKHQTAGSYDFGYIDSSKYTGSISYVPISTSNGFWEFNAGAYSVGSTNYGSLGDSIADTGTSLILVSNTVVQNYYKQVSGAQNSASAGGYIFPCSATLPTFGITIGSQKFTTPGSYINYAPLGNGYCYGGIQSSQGLGFNILGDVFLKSNFVVFDVGNTRLGVAKQR